MSRGAHKPAGRVIGRHAGGSFTATGQPAIGYDPVLTDSTHDRLAVWWNSGSAALSGFSLTGTVDAGIPGATVSWTIDSAADIPGPKGYWDQPNALGAAGIFSSYGDFYLSPATAAAWGMPAGANLLDHVFASAPGAADFAFPLSSGIGLTEPGTYPYAGGGLDSTNFEINGNYTDWFTGGTTGGSDSIDVKWSPAAGEAVAAQVEVSLLQPGHTVAVELFRQGQMIWSGDVAPADPVLPFGPGQAGIGQLNLSDLLDGAGAPVTGGFDEMRFLAGPGGANFLLDGITLTMADSNVSVNGAATTHVSAHHARLLFDAGAPHAGVTLVKDFSLAGGDQLVLRNADLAHLQVVAVNAQQDLAVRFIDSPGTLLLLKGAAPGFTALDLHPGSLGGQPEVTLARIAG